MPIPVVDAEPGDSGLICSLDGGTEFQQRLRALGVREGKSITIRAKHPFEGPVVIEVDGRQTTIGRGMADRILIEPQVPGPDTT
jgi:ferrous iron transport protein A